MLPFSLRWPGNGTSRIASGEAATPLLSSSKSSGDKHSPRDKVLRNFILIPDKELKLQKVVAAISDSGLLEVRAENIKLLLADPENLIDQFCMKVHGFVTANKFSRSLDAMAQVNLLLDKFYKASSEISAEGDGAAKLVSPAEEVYSSSAPSRSFVGLLSLDSGIDGGSGIGGRGRPISAPPAAARRDSERSIDGSYDSFHVAP